MPRLPSNTYHSPLERRFPALSLPERAPIGVEATGVELWEADGVQFWVKRDDLCAPVLGGNKARALQFLLGPRRTDETVVTVGGIGSTHVLATAVHARTLGVKTRAYRWRHESNDLTPRISRAIEAACLTTAVVGSPAHALGAAACRCLGYSENWVPFGGTSPLGMVGHVEAALELAEQVQRGELPEPESIVVALGTGGTAAGLAAGLSAAGMQSRVVAVRCGPTIGVDGARLAWLCSRVRRYLGARGAQMSNVLSSPVVLEHGLYAGAYSRPHLAAERLRKEIRERLGVGLDATYSAKACYAAWERARSAGRPVLFWQTFDARWLAGEGIITR